MSDFRENVWVHVKGGRYRIQEIAINEADMTPVVVYRAIHGKSVAPWVRPATEFFDGRFTLERTEKVEPVGEPNVEGNGTQV